MRLEISRSDLAAILADAAAHPGREVCGLLLGRGRNVEKVRACRNLADDPACAFEIDPAALIAAHRAARHGGPSVIGHYHSHPNGSTQPSARDLAAARNGEIWLIVTRNAAAAWLMTDGRSERLDIPASFQRTLSPSAADEIA